MNKIKTLLKKTVFKVQSEGILSTIVEIFKIFAQKTGFSSSITLIYRIDLSLTSLYLLNNFSQYHILVINDVGEFNNFYQVPQKLYFLPLKKWFERGSKCLAISKNRHLAAYTWIHKNFYDELGPAGALRLDENEAYIGPFYTDPLFRGKGLYYILMNYALHHLKKKNIVFLYGSSNIHNIATIKVLSKSNFNIIGIIWVQGNNYQIIDFTKEKKLNKKFYNEKN
ncbi:hypothetical protein JCM12298_29420 [Desulfothermus naphthae]